MTAISAMIASAQPVAAVIISVALMLFFGFAMTRITKLLRLPNFSATPHIGGNTYEALKKAGMEVVTETLRVLNGEKPAHPYLM